jgi:hypothetical protein
MFTLHVFLSNLKICKQGKVTIQHRVDVGSLLELAIQNMQGIISFIFGIISLDNFYIIFGKFT